VWIALLVLAGILLGGVVSFVRSRHWLAAVVLLAAAGLAFAGAMAWVPR
jgi:LPS O-antigen subunit length determinant protein (WzzB/FepE family)